ncbi:type II CAAX prenyl endopeptidase Rce1 family protein [Blastococcus montanus]|uniref:CPBP family intramembrane glutamic endopeptidase n=1 Tax=Blastococcus montanus TaxID=3144973 RepID=UPI00320A1158
MTRPGAGGGPADEWYGGPPPTHRPGPGQPPPVPWSPPPPPQWGPYPAPPPQWGPYPAPPPQWGPYPGPPPVAWALPPGTPPHDVPQPFLLAMRSRDWAWWRPVLGLLLIGVVFLVAGAVVGVIGILTGVSPDLALLDLTDPGVLLVTNATLIVAIPVVWLAWAVAHGMRPGWSSSVLARLRWRLLPRLTLLALCSLGVAVGLSALLAFTVGDAQLEGPVASWGWLLAVVLLTTPLQSAAEEYLFRGYLSQAIAGWIGRPAAGAVVAALVTATLFALAHLPPTPVAFLDYLAFALAASAVVWLTGGIEAAIVLHAVNNVLIFLLAGLLDDDLAAAGPVPAGVGLASLALTLAGTGAYVALVAWWRRRGGAETCTAAQDLRGPAVGAPVPAR